MNDLACAAARVVSGNPYSVVAGSERRGTSSAALPRMAIRIRTSGCLFSIVASVVLTVLLNVLLRACAH